MDFKTAITAMAAAQPNIEVAVMIDLAFAIENALTPSLDDAKALGHWASRQPAVANELAAGKKIHAIKELRALTNCSLAQAKNAIEAI